MIGPRDNTGTLEPFTVRMKSGPPHIGTPIVVEGWSTSTPPASRSARAARRDEAALDFGRGTNEYIRAAATASRSNAAST